MTLTDAYTDFYLGGKLPEICKRARSFGHDEKACPACTTLNAWRAARDKLLAIQSRVTDLRERGAFIP